MDLFLVLFGAVLLYAGGEALVRGSVALARLLGLSPLVIGLTVVSFGTSSPELASTLAASLRGSPDVAFGNVVGSNIANIGLILGLTAMIWPVATTASFLRREVPFMLFASGLLFVIVANDRISRVEGGALFALLILFLVYLLRGGEVLPATEEEFAGEFSGTGGGVPAIKSLVLVVIGIAMLVFGARALVVGGINLARLIGVSERVIGLTVVAVGTSLPELASSIVAAMKRESGILLGNLIGSNVFNVLCILGLTVLVRPIEIDAGAVWGDLIVMLGLSGLVWPFLATGLKMERWEGFVLLAVYAGYMIFLFA